MSTGFWISILDYEFQVCIGWPSFISINGGVDFKIYQVGIGNRGFYYRWDRKKYNLPDWK